MPKAGNQGNITSTQRSMSRAYRWLQNKVKVDIIFVIRTTASSSFRATCSLPKLPQWPWTPSWPASLRDTRCRISLVAEEVLW